MSLYSQVQLSTITTNAAPSYSMLASATNNPKLMELYLNIGNGTASAYGLGRPANDGSFTQTSGLAVLPEDPADPAGTTTTAVAWGTAPTMPTTQIRRAFLQAVIGSGAIFTFVHGLVIAPSFGLVLWNFATGAANLCIHVSVDE